jgi:hypothetical protein
MTLRAFNNNIVDKAILVYSLFTTLFSNNAHTMGQVRYCSAILEPVFISGLVTKLRRRNQGTQA